VLLEWWAGADPDFRLAGFARRERAAIPEVQPPSPATQ
jgi:hypothetical protein